MDCGAVSVLTCEQGYLQEQLPTLAQGKRRDVLTHIAPGNAPSLFGGPFLRPWTLRSIMRPAAGHIMWGNKAWKICPRGSKGESIYKHLIDASYAPGCRRRENGILRKRLMALSSSLPRRAVPGRLRPFSR